MRKKRRAIKHCYERRLKGNSRLNGTVVAELLIETDGTVVSSRADGFADRTVETCVADVIKTIVFPTPVRASHQIRVRYPFHFRPM